MAKTWVEERYRRSFEAKDESGQTHTRELYENLRISQPLSGPRSDTRTIATIRTRDGLNVNPLGGGKYQVVKTGLILHSDDPDAP